MGKRCRHSASCFAGCTDTRYSSSYSVLCALLLSAAPRHTSPKMYSRGQRGDVLTVWVNRTAQLQMQADTLQLKLMMATQAGAERMVRKALKYMKHRSLCASVLTWNWGLSHFKKARRARGLLQRAMRRMMLRQQMDAVHLWSENHKKSQQQTLARRLMRRAVTRMTLYEIGVSWAEWHRKHRADVINLWRQRRAEAEQLKQELATLQAKYITCMQALQARMAG